MKQLIRHIALITFIGLAGSSSGQEPEAKVKLSNSNIRIGQQLEMTLFLETHAKDTVVWPQITDTLRKEIEVLSKSKIDTAYQEDRISIKQLTQKFTLTSFDSGYYTMDPITFTVNGKLVETRPFLIEVTSVKVENPQEIRDIKGPIEAELTWMDYVKLYWHWPVGGAAAIALAFFLFTYFKNRKQQEPVVVKKPKPKTPPHLLAIKKLEALKAEKLWQSGKNKEYYSRLSNIIREYIENRFHVLALEQTTYEIMTEMDRVSDLDAEQSSALRDLLELSDLVKFAKQDTLPTENNRMWELAEEFVKSTMRPEKPESTEDDTTPQNAGADVQ